MTSSVFSLFLRWLRSHQTVVALEGWTEVLVLRVDLPRRSRGVCLEAEPSVPSQGAEYEKQRVKEELFQLPLRMKSTISVAAMRGGRLGGKILCPRTQDTSLIGVVCLGRDIGPRNGHSSSFASCFLLLAEMSKFLAPKFIT